MSATGKERLQMLYWLKRGIAKNRKELAQLLQRNEATISRWLLKYRCGGLAKLLEVKRVPGNPVKI
jgi:transposase